MENTSEYEGLDFAPGTLVGEWYFPTRGFQWRRDLRLIRPLAPQREGLSYTSPYTWQERESDPWLYRLSGEIERYPILRRRGLLSSFQKLARSPTEDRIKDFANRYGCLGRPGIVQVGRGRSPDTSVAEPLSLWLWELANFADLAKLRDAVVALQARGDYDRSRRRKARELLASRISWSPDQQRVFYQSALQNDLPQDADTLMAELSQALRRKKTLIAGVDGGEREQLAFSQLKPGNDLSAAQLALREAINERLTGNVDVALTPQAEIRFGPRDLLTAVYLVFALDLSGARPVEKACKNPRCPNGGTFFVKRQDQQHCSKNCREQAYYYRPPIGKKKGARDGGKKR